MTIAQDFRPEFDRESATTRRLLERVPEERLDWRPHAKSATLGWLAGHLAHLPTWLTIALEADEFDSEPGGMPVPRTPLPSSTREILARFDENTAACRARLDTASDGRMLGRWSLRKAGQTPFVMPRVAVVRDFILNLSIHHCGQLTVYLRLLDLPLPSVYGPTADEPA